MELACRRLRGDLFVFDNNDIYTLENLQIDIDYYYNRRTIIENFPQKITLNPGESFNFMLLKCWGALDKQYTITFQYIKNNRITKGYHTFTE